MRNLKYYFSRLHSLFNLLPLDLGHFRGPILKLKNTWKYLEFIFDRKLSFQQHIKFYSNKALSIIKCMKILGNSTWELLPYQKCLLYRICILPIVLYSFPLWHFNNTLLLHLLKKLRKMQHRAALWILDTFCTFPTLVIKVITDLLSIHLHFQKLSVIRRVCGQTSGRVRVRTDIEQ